jgi:hypothetical protein
MRITRPHTRALGVGLIVAALSACASSDSSGPDLSIQSLCTRTVTIDDIDSPVVHGTAGHHAHFTIRNTSATANTAAVTCTATNATCTGVFPSTLTLSPGQASEVTVTFTAGAPGVGKVGAASCNGSNSARTTIT